MNAIKPRYYKPRKLYLLTEQIIDSPQCQLTNQGIGRGEYRHVKPKTTASGFNGLDPMSGGFNVRDLPAPKTGMLVFVYDKW
jgi:hypothetical protein